MDIQQDGTTYIKLHPSTRFGYSRSSQHEKTDYSSIPKQDTNNFFTVAALYCKKMNSEFKNDVDHYVHIGVNMFGSGGFSNAVGVSETGVAKFPKIAPGDDEFSEKEFYRDLITELRTCLHPPIKVHENIIQMQNIQWAAGLNVSDSGKFDFMWPVLEFEKATGTLAKLLGLDPVISFRLKINLCLDIAKGLDCLHDCGIVHSDIKSENVFIFPHPRRRYIAKIGDFGCSTILEDTGTCTSARLSGYTRLWCAPECDEEMDHAEIYRVDIYSFGLMLWQVITDGKTPFDWFSWTDCAPLSLDDILALKGDGCMLPLALDALTDLPLDEQEKNICAGIFNGTLGCNKSRVDYLSPLIEKYWVSCWGPRYFDSQKLGVKQYLEPKPPMNIQNVLMDVTLDHRVPMQIFDSIKWHLSCAYGARDGPGIASDSYQLFLCYYYGYGTDRDTRACMSTLAEAARYGCSEAQDMVAQFFDAHGMEVPEDLPICDWLEEQALIFTPGASRTLKNIDPERYEKIISKLRMSAETAVGLCSFSIQGVGSLIPQLAHSQETRALIEEIETITRNDAGLNLIHIASASGNLPVVQSLLEHTFCDLDIKDAYGRTPLHHACHGGHRDVALLLLSRYSIDDRGPFPDREELIETCFHSLISFDSTDMLEVVTSLMRLPGTANATSMFTAESILLQRALMEDNIEAVRILIGYGEKRTYPAIMMAAFLRCGEILHLFLHDFAEKEGPLDLSILQSLLQCAVNGDTFKSIKLHGFKHTSAVISTVETIHYYIQLWYPHSRLEVERAKCEILYNATITRRLDTLQLVLDPFFKSSIPLSSKLGDSVLVVPLGIGDTGMFSLFLDNGAAEYNDDHIFENGRARGVRYRTIDKLFAMAVQSSNPFFIRRFLEKGIWLDEQRLHKAAICVRIDEELQRRFCPFQLAVLKTCYDTATFLAKHTMQIETDMWSWNSFLSVIIPMQLNLGFTMIDYLLTLKEGPKPLPSADGSTILHFLSRMYSVEPDSRRSRLRKFWAGLMIRFRDQIDIQTPEGQTPLDYAIEQHNILMVEALLEAGANPNILDPHGLTSLDRLLIARSIQVLRRDPKAPPPTASQIAIKRHKHFDLESLRQALPVEGNLIDTESLESFDSINGFKRDYQGDSFDERLCKIYTMIRKAGGISTQFPNTLLCTKRLEDWTSMWVRLGREEISYPIGELRVVIDRLVRFWGDRLRLAHGDGRVSYLNVNPCDGSVTFDRCR